MRMTKELTKIVKLYVLEILDRHPDGLTLVELEAKLVLSRDWPQDPPLPAPSLSQFERVLRELQRERQIRERVIPGKFVSWVAVRPGLKAMQAKIKRVLKKNSKLPRLGPARASAEGVNFQPS